MKQHITEKQLDKLSDQAKFRLSEWKSESQDRWTQVYYKDADFGETLTVALPLLSIGQMIEFLISQGRFIAILPVNSGAWAVAISTDNKRGWKEFKKKMLCDSLWEAVFEELL